MTEPKIKIKTVREVLGWSDLCIPPYQRPYAWNTKNVNQLWKDFLTFKEQNSQVQSSNIDEQKKEPIRYRLGTLVLYENGDDLEIVDGQQRLLTLSLLVKALEKEGTKGFKFSAQRFLPRFPYSVPEQTRYNLQANFQLLRKLIYETKTEIENGLLEFVFERCEFVIIILNDISEAFQFFDAQNSRGKSLKPHDLLKAFHLRKFSAVENKDGSFMALMKKTVKHWEDTEEAELARFFSNYLYRIRRWMYGKGISNFTNEDLPLFKGVDLQDTPGEKIPLTRLYQTLVRGSGASIDGQSDWRFPHQLEQPIINGRLFFEWVKHYQQWQIHQPSHLSGESSIKTEITKYNEELFKLLTNYRGCWRSGDNFVRNLFYCLLMAYIDRFGFERLDKAVKVIFIWAYTIRLKSKKVGIDSINKHVLDENLFVLLRNAVTPDEFLDIELKQIKLEFKDGKPDLVKGLEDSIYKQFDAFGYVNKG